MNYYEILEEKAKLGFDELKNYLQTDKNLIWTIVDETDDTMTVEIETWDDEYYNTEFLMSCEFDADGNFIQCA